MSWFLAAVPLVAAALLSWGAALTGWRRRDAPGADLFGVVSGVVGAGALAIAISLALRMPRTVVVGIAIVVGLVLPIPWFLFSVEYTGRTELVSLDVATVVASLPAIGIVATALILGSQVVPWLRLPTRGTATGLTALFVSLLTISQWFALLYAGGLVLAGSGLLLWTFHRYEYLDSRSGIVLGVFGTVPWLSVLFGFQVAGSDPLALPGTVAAGFLAGGLAAGYGLGTSHLFRQVPAAGNVGPRTIVEDLEDVVIVTDDKGTIVELNDVAERTLDTTASDVVGTTLEHLLEVPLADLRATDTVALQSITGRVLLEPTVSELTDQHGQCLGYAIVLRDVTARTTRQQRLDVLNRVLRHNLRNDMTLVLGHAQRLRENVADPDLAESADDIVRVGEELTSLSEDIREIDRLMEVPGTAQGEIRFLPLAESVLRAAVADSAATYECDVPDGVVVEGSEELLELVLTNLVENGIEHNDREAPRVEVHATYESARQYPLVVSCLDDGPGIPPMERQAIERGTETPLQHGSGLGLWAVRWAVTRLGGELDVERREPRGTAVTIRLPRARGIEMEVTSSENRG